MFDKTSLINDIKSTILNDLCAGKDSLANSIANGIANAVDAYVRKIAVSAGIPVSTSGGGGATTGPGILS